MPTGSASGPPPPAQIARADVHGVTLNKSGYGGDVVELIGNGFRTTVELTVGAALLLVVTLTLGFTLIAEALNKGVRR
ncbi:hypothetical protein RM779_07345 [Streptomyces sp. DSM 41886]|uniref:ABC transporter permease n=2 Tax=Streptomyces johnsoniae TaxID=3075532 RepID=A0ABU2S140_9ACTN|nr:hypothetical protein [Streptomyces sp. DSM 41886]